jgi:hypothetical protein
MKTLIEFGEMVGRSTAAVRKRAMRAGIKLGRGISPTSGQTVLVITPAVEKELLKLYPKKLEVLKK